MVQQLGIEGISKSQVSELAQHLDAQRDPLGRPGAIRFADPMRIS